MKTWFNCCSTSLSLSLSGILIMLELHYFRCNYICETFSCLYQCVDLQVTATRVRSKTAQWGSLQRDTKVKSLCFNYTSLHEGVRGKWRYSSTHSLTSALDGSQLYTPANLHPGKEPLVPIG